MTNELTQAAVAQLLYFNANDNGRLHWLKAPTGAKGRTLAGSATKDGARVIQIKGRRYTQHRIEHLLAHGTLPATRRRQAKAPAPVLKLVPQVPQQLPEVTRAVVAAAPPAHRGWLAGLGLRKAA